MFYTHNKVASGGKTSTKQFEKFEQIVSCGELRAAPPWPFLAFDARLSSCHCFCLSISCVCVYVSQSNRGRHNILNKLDMWSNQALGDKMVQVSCCEKNWAHVSTPRWQHQIASWSEPQKAQPGHPKPAPALSLSLSLSTYLSIYLSIYLVFYLSIYLSISLSLSLSFSLSSNYLSTYLFIYLSIYLSICLSIYLSI